MGNSTWWSLEVALHLKDMVDVVREKKKHTELLECTHLRQSGSHGTASGVETVF